MDSRGMNGASSALLPLTKERDIATSIEASPGVTLVLVNLHQLSISDQLSGDRPMVDAAHIPSSSRYMHRCASPDSTSGSGNSVVTERIAAILLSGILGSTLSLNQPCWADQRRRVA